MHVRRLPSGNWQGIVTLPGGRKRTRSFPLRSQAKAWATNLEADLAAGVFVDPAGGRLTVEAWYQRWSAARVVERATSRKNTAHWRTHVEPRWGSVPLGSVTRLEVQEWVSALARDQGAWTVQGAYNLLSSLMRAAAAERIIGVNPCTEIVLPRPPTSRLRWFTREEATAILDELEEPDRTLVDLSMTTGLRWGEAAGLHADQVEWLHRRLWVTRVRTRDGVRAYPKSARSHRVVPLTDDLVEALSSLPTSGPMFGELHDTNWRRRVWAPALERAGVEYAPPHTMRHTAASWLVQAGVPLYEVQQLLGHESFATTMRYAHLAPDAHDTIRQVWAGGARAVHAAGQEGPRKANRGPRKGL